jgi:DNA mismatch repair ATPase MutS
MIFLFLILANLIAFVCVVLGKLEAYFSLSIFMLSLGFFIENKYKRSAEAHPLSIIKSKWGMAVTRNRDFSEICSRFNKNSDIAANKYAIDERTWGDLDMDLVYSQIDRTLTVPGEQILYSMLRRPVLHAEELHERDSIFDLYSQDSGIREKHQVILSRLGKEGGSFLADLLWGDRPAISKFALIYRFVPILVLICILFGVINSGLVWFGIVVIFIFNMIVHYRTKRQNADYFPTINYLGGLIGCANKLANCQHPVLENYLTTIKTNINILSSAGRRTRYSNMVGKNIFFDYFNILFLIEVRAFFSMLSIIDRYEDQLKALFDISGLLDASISIASYRAGLTHFSRPIFVSPGSPIAYEKIVHPLLRGAVPNSLSLTKGGVLVTGSNMSGKTTFLKTIGVITILAQSINTCLAQSYQSCFFRVISLMGREDNLVKGRSYYLDEIIGMRRIIDASNSAIPSLCLLDEIFRGTNSIERIFASAEVLRYLANNNCCVFATSHELELADLLGQLYHYCHFQEEVKEDGLFFNYKLIEGVARTHTAIKLLRYVGFPESIIEAAESRIRAKINENKNH